jgi:hypothetical protein
MVREKRFAFERAGLRYFTNAPFSRPTASGPISPDAPVCGNCANFCPVGPGGVKANHDGTPPKPFAAVLDRWWREDFAENDREGLTARDEARRGAMLEFMTGLGLCVALPPTTASGYGAPATHATWWCGCLARLRA